ncbi:MAG TPA: LUD domain-containing protein [Candidatus Bathyarchaeia archaeon]|nr:LUD domain-containing protein [Candidatus Bathyarchaeia archaeon]
MSETYFQENRREIKKRIRDERLDAIRKSDKEGWKRRTSVEKRINLIELARQVRAVKEDSLKRLDELVKIARESLERNGIQTYYARTAKEAADIFLEVIGDAKFVAKSAADVPNEIGLPRILEKKGIELLNTDFGYLLWNFVPEEYGSTKGIPMVHISLETMAKAISKKTGTHVKPEREDILRNVKKVAERFLGKAEVGLTGANAIAANEGSIVLIHEQGNINRVISLPQHVVMAGIDKVVPTLLDSVAIAELTSVYQLGRPPSNMNIVSAPTEDWNMELKPTRGIFGSREIHVIMVDNGRTKAIEKGFAECLYCTRCFACHNVCPAQERVRNLFGYNNSYISGRGIILSAFVAGLKEAVESGLFLCTLCGACKEECPIDIDVPTMIRRLRVEAVSKGLVPKADTQMDNNVRDTGNPFGEPERERTRWMNEKS